MTELFEKMSMEQLLFLYDFFEDMGNVEGKLAYESTDEHEKNQHERFSELSFEMWMILAPYINERTKENDAEAALYIDWARKRAQE